MVAISTASGDAYQTVRMPDGTWLPFGRVFQHTSSRNFVHQVDIVALSSIVAIMGDLKLLEEFNDKSTVFPKFIWSPPHSIAGGTEIDMLAVTEGEFQVIALKGAPGPSGLLQSYAQTLPWPKLSTFSPAPDLSTLPLDRLGSVAGVCPVTDRPDGPSRPRYVLVTDADGDAYFTELAIPGPYKYSAFMDLRDEAGYPGFITEADLCDVSGGLFACVRTDEGKLFYTVRPPAGKWTAFDHLRVKTRFSASAPVAHVSVSEFNYPKVGVHIVVTTDPTTEDGGLYHAMRLSDGSFTAFEDVKALAGDPGPIATARTFVVLDHLG